MLCASASLFYNQISLLYALVTPLYNFYIQAYIENCVIQFHISYQLMNAFGFSFKFYFVWGSGLQGQRADMSEQGDKWGPNA